MTAGVTSRLLQSKNNTESYSIQFCKNLDLSITVSAISHGCHGNHPTCLSQIHDTKQACLTALCWV